MAGLLGSKGFYNWTGRLAVTPVSRQLRTMTEQYWAWAARAGLEEPAFSVERWSLDMQEAHPLLYPHKYAEIGQRRLAKAKRRQADALAVAGNPELARRRLASKEMFDDEVSLDRIKGPKVLILGDSIMMTVGPVLKNAVVKELGGGAVVRAKLATGLARPDVYDWAKALQKMVQHRRYDYIVMLFGTNDSQDFVENGRILTYGSTAWVAAYNRRLAHVMAEACLGAKQAVWIGLPPMQSASFNRKALRINSWAQRQASRHSCMSYVGTERVLGDEEGRFTSYRQIDDRLEKVRMVDGIHVTARGGSLISSALLGLMTGGGLLAH